MMLAVRGIFLAAARRNPPAGVPYVSCLNNTSCLCYTNPITYNSSFSFSAWMNISNSQPSLSEGRTICFVGEVSKTSPRGIEFGLTYRNSAYHAIGAFVQGSGVMPAYWSYAGYLEAWHNVVVTYTSGSCKTYVDGILKNTNGGTYYTTWSNVRFSICCLRWQNDNIISGGPIGKYANVAFWDRVLSASEIADVASGIDYIPTSASHRYVMQIQNGKIADVGTSGGWDFTTIRDFENGLLIP